MDIRDRSAIDKYNEAKEFIKWYDDEYRKVIRANYDENLHADDWYFIWRIRYEIVSIRCSYTILYNKKLDECGQHPSAKQIRNRLGYIKDSLLKIYGTKDLRRDNKITNIIN